MKSKPAIAELKCTFEDAENQRLRRDMALSTEQKIAWLEEIIALHYSMRQQSLQNQKKHPGGQTSALSDS